MNTRRLRPPTFYLSKRPPYKQIVVGIISAALIAIVGIMDLRALAAISLLILGARFLVEEINTRNLESLGDVLGLLDALLVGESISDGLATASDTLPSGKVRSAAGDALHGLKELGLPLATAMETFRGINPILDELIVDIAHTKEGPGLIAAFRLANKRAATLWNSSSKKRSLAARAKTFSSWLWAIIRGSVVGVCIAAVFTLFSIETGGSLMLGSFVSFLLAMLIIRYILAHALLRRALVIILLGASFIVLLAQEGESNGVIAASQPTPIASESPSTATPTTEPLPTEPEQGQAQKICLIDAPYGGNVFVRVGPSVRTAPLSHLQDGERVIILEEKDGWYRFEKGWFHSQFCLMSTR